MKLIFPPDFIFGTSTSAYQIETAFEHDWCGVKSEDGHLFESTTHHELKYEEDVNIISSLAPNYRMSLMWSKLQRHALGDFDLQTKTEYHSLLSLLKSRNVDIMMVLHHFANPVWFAKLEGWEHEKNVMLWFDFARKVVDEFGDYVVLWNTFNEPNLYASLAYGTGKFPPYKKNILAAIKVIRNISLGHNMIYDYIKQKYPNSMIGISHNCAVFEPHNFLGIVPAKLADLWYMEFLPRHFSKVDYFGMSYYARITHDPFPITNLYTPEKIKKLGKQHDDIWEYYPEGLRVCMERYWKQYHKPIIITENGFCTQDDSKRISSIRDYMQVLHKAIHDGIDVRGYYHWSAWDNFEWFLGPTYRFGLYGCDINTKERCKKPSADVYATLAYNKEIEVHMPLTK